MIAVANEEIVLVFLNELEERFYWFLDGFSIGAVHDKLYNFLSWVTALLVLITEVIELLNHLLDTIIAVALHNIAITELIFDILEGYKVLKGYHINNHRNTFITVGLFIEVLIALND